MKLNSQKGFIVQGLIAVVALIAIATGAYYLGTQKESSNTNIPNLNDDHGAPDSIIVKSPKAGEKLEIGKTYTISWENYRGTEDLNIKMVGEGNPKTAIRRLGMVNGKKSGTYDIVVPDLDVLDEYHIEVYPDGGREWVGRSGVFTIFKSISNINQTSSTSSSDWKIYKNDKYGFEVKYPNKINSNIGYINNEEWYTSGNYNSISFGTPSSKSGGLIWNISIQSKDGFDIEKNIKLMGNQFSDRRESRQNFSIDGIPVLLVTIKTDTNKDWVLKVIYIEKDNKVYMIENGAIDIPEFIKFYNSFKFTN